MLSADHRNFFGQQKMTIGHSSSKVTTGHHVTFHSIERQNLTMRAKFYQFATFFYCFDHKSDHLEVVIFILKPLKKSHGVKILHTRSVFDVLSNDISRSDQWSLLDLS